MRLAVCGLTALRVFRDVRRRDPSLLARRTAAPAPDPSPQKRWTPNAVPRDALLLADKPTKERPIDVAVPEPSCRLGALFARNTVYGAGVAPDSFVDLGNGIAIPCPELLFVDMVGRLRFPVLVLLGYELCGTFGRDALNPMMGDVSFDLAPATSVEKIEAFLASCPYLPGKEDTRRALGCIADNAWSPMEAVLATMLTLPVVGGGYGLGELRLNVRCENPVELVRRGCPSSRVPDIELAVAPVGFNYDGRGHYDLASLAAADDDDAKRRAVREVRRKYVDDLRRNRELLAMGKAILPVCAEDLFEGGGLDALVLETLSCIESAGVEVPSYARGIIESPGAAEKRQELLWSMLPWSEAPAIARGLDERTRVMREQLTELGSKYSL